MSKDTISVTTYAEPEPITVPEAPDGGRSAISTVPSWGDKSDVLGDLTSGSMRLVRREIPVDTIERELQKLIDLMNRIFSQAEQSTEHKSTAESIVTPTVDKKRLQLNEVSLAVEITAEGGLSILGTGGKLGGKGGMTLKFTKG
jgi:transcription initiation factor TFIIIB Brf1 subunit/transcription initiation factor TFIIB